MTFSVSGSIITQANEAALAPERQWRWQELPT
jgi:hypothetical protein